MSNVWHRNPRQSNNYSLLGITTKQNVKSPNIVCGHQTGSNQAEVKQSNRGKQYEQGWVWREETLVSMNISFLLWQYVHNKENKML